MTTMSFVGFAMPTFWSGLLAILVFSVWLRWLPAGGMYTVGEAFPWRIVCDTWCSRSAS